MSQIPGFTEARNAAELIDVVANWFAQSDIFYGHGTDNPRDEAAALVFYCMQLDHTGDADQYSQVASADVRREIAELANARVATHQPLSYLTGEAWFAGLAFHVNPDVLIPRSPLAELIAARFEPWQAPSGIASILEVGTGSGCIAVACALALPHARITATDLSADALIVAAHNLRRHNVDDRVTLVKTDIADGIVGEFDLLISNPPYVPSADIAGLPKEYHYEPEFALASGNDGLDSARRILQDAAQLLSPTGLLVLEVGEQWQALQNAYPQLPFHWLEFENGGVGVGLLDAAALQTS